MEKIVVLSDSHGSLTAWKKAEKYFNGAEMVLHAGDILYHGSRNPLPEGYDTSKLADEILESNYNLLAVKGNVDALVDDWVLPYPLPEYAVVDDNGLRIVIYHGYQHETSEERAAFARRFGADILIFGHTHLPLIEKKDGVILLNPGSIALPKQKPAVPTLALLEEENIKILNLDNGKKITAF